MTEYSKNSSGEGEETSDDVVDPTELHQAVRRVVESSAQPRFSETTTPSMRTMSIEERAAIGARKDREISLQGKKQALGLDNADDSHLALSEEDRATGDRAKKFIDGMLDDIDSFDVAAYLQKHPDKRTEAKELGFLRSE